MTHYECDECFSTVNSLSTDIKVQTTSCKVQIPFDFKVHLIRRTEGIVTSFPVYPTHSASSELERSCSYVSDPEYDVMSPQQSRPLAKSGKSPLDQHRRPNFPAMVHIPYRKSSHTSHYNSIQKNGVERASQCTK